MTDTHDTPTQPTQPERTSFWRRRPAIWIAGGLGAAVLLVGGAGLGAAMADDDDDDRSVATDRSAVAATGGADDTNGADDTDDTDEPASPAPAASAPATATIGATDAAALTGVLTAALDETTGTATSMEAHRNGSWSVDVEAGNGDETTVLVAADGTASVVRTEPADADDANDPAPAGKLDRANIAALVKAALAETKGAIVDVDLDDNPAEAYSVQVRADDGTETEIDLDTDVTVTQVEVDRD